MSGYFIYNGVKSADIGVYVNGTGTYGMPVPNVKRVNIPNRDGDLLDDYNNYQNIQITYHCSAEANNIDTVLSDIAGAWLRAGRYCRLTDTYHPDIYRMALPIANVTPDVFRPNGGLPYRAMNFDLTFSCKPQKFLVSGETPIAISGSTVLTNPTQFKSKPMLIVSGSGTITINNNYQINVLSSQSNMTIDCETMDAYSDGTNLNQYVEMPLDDVVLEPGDNSISVSGLSVSVIPRWWKL